MQAAEQPDFQEAEDALFRGDGAVFVFFSYLLSAVRDICAVQEREVAHLLWFLLIFPLNKQKETLAQFGVNTTSLVPSLNPVNPFENH